MNRQNYRIAVVGATSLLGREIAEELANGPLADADIVLMDNEQESGKLDQVRDEVTFIQSVEAGSFEGVDVAIFATRGDAERHIQTAREMGVAVVDASGALGSEAPVRSPLKGDGGPSPLDLETSAVSAAHPVATMLAAVLGRLGRVNRLHAAFATVLQPASEHGALGLDELHQQTVNLLSFQSMPKETFDAQVAFNLLPRFGEEAKAELGRGRERVEAQLRVLLGSAAPLPVMQWVQAPVFHGFAVSLFVEFEGAVAADAVEKALSGELLDLVSEDADPPSNLSAAGQGGVLVEVRPEPALAGESTRFAVWMVADNLKLLAQTAVGCAVELSRLRPLGKVQ